MNLGEDSMEEWPQKKEMARSKNCPQQDPAGKWPWNSRLLGGDWLDHEFGMFPEILGLCVIIP